MIAIFCRQILIFYSGNWTRLQGQATGNGLPDALPMMTEPRVYPLNMRTMAVFSCTVSQDAPQKP
jgi:hypothetical protein